MMVAESYALSFKIDDDCIINNIYNPLSMSCRSAAFCKRAIEIIVTGNSELQGFKGRWLKWS